MDMLSDFLGYLQALSQHWLALMSAGPFLIEKLLSLLWRSARERLAQHPKARLSILSIMLLGIFIAGFQTWDDEHIKATTHTLQKLNPILLYQDGYDIAATVGVDVDLRNNIITFAAVTARQELDLGKQFEFRDWKVSCSGAPGPMMTFGAMRQITYPNFVCRIQGNR